MVDPLNKNNVAAVIRGMNNPKNGGATRLFSQAADDAKKLNQEANNVIAQNNLSQQFAEAMNLFKLVSEMSAALTRNGKQVASNNLQAIA
jgi:hypothetical protein